VDCQLKIQLKLGFVCFSWLLNLEAGVSEGDVCSVCASKWPGWVGGLVVVEWLLFLGELAECREREKDEPSVDATCEEGEGLS